MKIGTLIGFGLYQFDYLKDPEVDTFRRRIARFLFLFISLFLNSYSNEFSILEFDQMR